MKNCGIQGVVALTSVILSGSVVCGYQVKVIKELEQCEKDITQIKMSYGTCHYNNYQDKTVEFQTIVQCTKDALEEGFGGIDSANHHSYNEKAVGEGLKQFLDENTKGIKRKDIWVQTKFSPATVDENGYPKKEDKSLYETVDKNGKPIDIKDQVKQSVNMSLKNLQLKTIDSLVLHSPYATRADTQKAWEAMEEFVTAKKVQCLGISHMYNKDELEWLISIASPGCKPRVIQNALFMVGAAGCDESVRNYCVQSTNPRIVYQPFAFVSGYTKSMKANREKHFAHIHANETYNNSKIEKFARYLLTKGYQPLCGSKTKAHRDELRNCISKDPMIEADVSGMDRLLRASVDIVAFGFF